MTTTFDAVWYAAYGSNMHGSRLRSYLAGGTPEGSSRAMIGCRDPSPPRRWMPIMLPGVLFFATESVLWTGGRAFYDPDGPGETPARAYLLTVGQFSDIVAQEMYRDPGADLDLTTVATEGRQQLGPGRYETLVRAGEFEGHPILTCTAASAYDALPGVTPSARYLRHLAAGLYESHGWTTASIAEYLATRPGAQEQWTPESVAAALAG
ncbi:histone deacetylase [Nocardia callitridis]|uniref:Histone deacetylase n=1 Tax=Nocardia callitridis TaxID=648753 RepID=A0ABP9KMX4_9NOCA